MLKNYVCLGTLLGHENRVGELNSDAKTLVLFFHSEDFSLALHGGFVVDVDGHADQLLQTQFFGRYKKHAAGTDITGIPLLFREGN